MENIDTLMPPTTTTIPSINLFKEIVQDNLIGGVGGDGPPSMSDLHHLPIPTLCQFPENPTTASTINFIYCILYFIIWIFFVASGYFFYRFNSEIKKIKANGHSENRSNIIV